MVSSASTDTVSSCWSASAALPAAYEQRQQQQQQHQQHWEKPRRQGARAWYTTGKVTPAPG